MEQNKLYEKCLRCNRPLKSQKAKERGYGEHCWQVYNFTKKKTKPTIFDKYRFLKDNKSI